MPFASTFINVQGAVEYLELVLDAQYASNDVELCLPTSRTHVHYAALKASAFSR